MSAQDIINKYIKFFEDRGHRRIPNSPLVPENDPTTLFTSSGMQPLVPYLLGEPHPEGNRLVDVQNCFRSVDIDEVGDNRHTTFFRMLGNWSLGDYFKEEEIPWLWEFLTRELGLPKEKLYITVFKGFENIEYDHASEIIWKDIFERENLEPKVFADETNWWSRSGTPEQMPAGEPGGPDTEVYFKFDDVKHSGQCKGDNPTKCGCGGFFEIANSVFMQYIKGNNGSFKELPKRNVDFGGGLERLLAAVEDKSDIFQTSTFSSILRSIEVLTGKEYLGNERTFRITADHLRAAVMVVESGAVPSNKEQGYILRRLLRRSFDNWHVLKGGDLAPVIEGVIEEGSKTDPQLKTNFERIKNTILEEHSVYKKALEGGKKLIEKELARKGVRTGDELKGLVEISADLAFKSLASYGLSPTQLKSLGYDFNEQELAEKIKEHQGISRKGAGKKFSGGLADHSAQTIKGHTATHLLHQAIRDMLGTKIHQSGSNITSERVRFDFNFDRNLTHEELAKLEQKVNEKIRQNLPVKFEIMSIAEAKEMGAIGLFDDKYSDKVKVYTIGPSTAPSKGGQALGPYSVEFCGGPHVNFTSEVKSFKIRKQESLGRGLRRLYAVVG
ncbi:MAG: alanine--tRNA ligase [Candidatus Levybacteria bacterium]|nr:alanine--tRNA ligase [Candidatus Levybacteria bacterium]